VCRRGEDEAASAEPALSARRGPRTPWVGGPLSVAASMVASSLPTLTPGSPCRLLDHEPLPSLHRFQRLPRAVGEAHLHALHLRRRSQAKERRQLMLAAVAGAAPNPADLPDPVRADRDAGPDPVAVLAGARRFHL